MPTASRPCEELAIALRRIKALWPFHRSADERPASQRPGIKRKLMTHLMLLVTLIIGMLWLCQIVWLDDLYRWQKKRQVEAACESVVQNLESPRLDRLMEHYASRNDMCIILLEKSGSTICASSDIRSCLIHRMSNRSLNYWCDMAPMDGSMLLQLFDVQLNENTNIHEYVGDVPPIENGATQSLLCARRVELPGGGEAYLLLNTIITPLDTTVETLRMLLAVITLVTIALAIVLASFTTRRISQPIIRTNEAARALSRSQYAPPREARAYREIAELNETLHQAAEELSQVEHLQHELIANISHDLRTPLTMIGGYAEVMRDIPGEATPENLQIVIDETNRLTSLVNELLDFSRLQTGHTGLECAPFDLTASVQAIAQRVAKLVESDGYIVQFTPQSHVWVNADEKRIGQVVYNLVGNALTYTGKDRTVTIAQTIRGSAVRMSITDTGKGIAPEEIPLIWNRYYRAHESHKRAIIGSGLGLSIVRSVLEKHGANFGVDSRLGEGTTFWFELPILSREEKL